MDISLIFGAGSLSRGFDSVVANVDGKRQCQGSLPGNEKLVELQRKWFLLYQALLQRFNPSRRSVFEVDEGDVTNVSEGSFYDICQEIKGVFNQWLNSESFRGIVHTLHQQLGKAQHIRVIIQSEDKTLQKLPWHLWDYVEHNPQVGISLSSLNYDLESPQQEQSNQVSVLAIFGDSTGIDLERDRAGLNHLTNADITVLEEPSRQEFNDQLWNQQWDVLFFAGHSNSNQSGGEIGLNANESLSLADLKQGLRQAIHKGLKLAIFNSCDGLELAHLLGELNLPQLIVMQADVPNPVAQHFLNYFLKALIGQGKSIELAHRQAKEQLEGVENDYPGATWLPVLFQNPSINWHPLSSSYVTTDWQVIAQEMLTRQVTSNPLTSNQLGTRFELDDIFVPLGLMERKQVERKKDSASAEQGSQFYQQEEVTQRYEQQEFFEQVLTQGNTPKSGGKRLAIIGEPGAGKTTQLQKMGDWLSHQPGNLVIWLSLADLQGQTLEDYLLTVWLKKALKTPRVNPEQEDKLINLFQQQSVWLLLDGVDEMGESSPLRGLASQLRQGWLSSARVILTCRLNVWDAGKNALEEFDVYRNLDFSDELRQEFTRKWFQQTPELAEALEQQLNRPGKERIRNLVRNPLRLTLLCAFWQQRQGELPETKAQLYEQFVNIFYQWKEESFPIASTQQKELNQALGRLAKKALDQPSGRFRLRKEQVCSVLGDEETSLFQAAINIGWLNQVGVAQENPNEPVFAFFHPTFEEYFAAITIDDWHFFLTHYPSNPQQGIYRIFEPQWKEVFLLWLGRREIENRQKESLIEALWNFEDNCGNYFQLRARCLAIAGIGEFKESQQADEIVNWGVSHTYGYLDYETQEWKETNPVDNICKDALLESDSQRVVEKSLDILKHYPSFILYYCTKWCEVIGHLSPKNTEAVSRLNELLDLNPNWEWHIPYGIAVGLERIQQSGIIAEGILNIDPNHEKANRIAESSQACSDSQSPPIEDIYGKVKHSLVCTDLLLEELFGYDPVERCIKEFGCQNKEEAERFLQYIEEVSLELIKSKINSLDFYQIKQGICLLFYHFQKDHQTIKTILDLISSRINVKLKKLIIQEFDCIAENFRNDSYVISVITKSIKNENHNKNELFKIKLLCSIYDYRSHYRYQNHHPDIYSYILKLINKTYNKEVCLEALRLLGDRVETDLTIKSNLIHQVYDKAINSLLNSIYRFNDTQITLKSVSILNRLDHKDLTIVEPLKNIIKNDNESQKIFNALKFLYQLVPTEPDLPSLLKHFVQTCNESKVKLEAIQLLQEIAPYDQNVLDELKRLIQTDLNEQVLGKAIQFWSKEINNRDAIPVIIPRVKSNEPTPTISKPSMLLHCAQNISYPEFYQAWHYQLPTPHPEVEGSGASEFDPSLEEQFLFETLSQLEATPNAYPIPIDADCIAEETEKSAIAQELLNQIYETAFPDVNPPTANNAPEITRNLPEIKNRLQVNELALILYNCEPESNPELKNLCRQLSRKLKMAWITEQPLDPPLQGFQLQPNLGTVIQNWLNEI